MKPVTHDSYVKLMISFTVDKPIVYLDYTGKLVKTIVATASERLAEEIASRRPGEAKPLSLSPVYTLGRDGKPRALYPHTASPNDTPRPVTLQPGRTYFFNIGVAAALEPEIQAVIMRLLAGHRIPTRSGEATVTLTAAERLNHYTTTAGPTIAPRPGQCIKVVLSAPTLPTSPYHPGSRVKRLTTSPLHLFAVNLHALYRRPDPRALAALDLLTPSPSSTRTVATTWYHYSGRTLPALTGYIKYCIDDTVEASNDQLETLGHILSHAATMGAGSSRATGFGDLKITTTQP